MYSLRQLFNQEPSRITAAIGQVLTTIAVLGWSPLTDTQNLGIVGTLNTILVLLYIGPRVVSTGKLGELDAALDAAETRGKRAAPVKAAKKVVPAKR